MLFLFLVKVYWLVSRLCEEARGCELLRDLETLLFSKFEL